MKLHRCLSVAGLVACLSAMAAPKPGDVIFNESFDAFPLGPNQTSLPDGWTVTGGTVDVIGAPGIDPRPGHGHYIDLQGSSGQPGRLSVAIPVETAGSYVVEFDWSGNPRGSAGALGVDTGPAPGTDGLSFIVQVAADTPFLRSGHGTGDKSAGAPFVLSFFTPPFVDTPTDHVVTGTGLLLDNVTVTFVAVAIPEPANFALLLLGIVPVVHVSRRRRAQLPLHATDVDPQTRA